MLFYRFPLKIEQKSAYNQRKVVVFYKFPLKIEYFCFLVSRMVISWMACLGFVGRCTSMNGMKKSEDCR